MTKTEINYDGMKKIVKGQIDFLLRFRIGM